MDQCRTCPFCPSTRLVSSTFVRFLILTFVIGFACSTGEPWPSRIASAVDVVMEFAREQLHFAPADTVLYAWSIGGFGATYAAMQASTIFSLFSVGDSIDFVAGTTTERCDIGCMLRRCCTAGGESLPRCTGLDEVSRAPGGEKVSCC